MSDEEKKETVAEALSAIADEEEQGLAPWRVEKVRDTSVPNTSNNLDSNLVHVLNKLDENGYAPRFILPVPGGLLVVAALAFDEESSADEIDAMTVLGQDDEDDEDDDDDEDRG